MTLKVDTQLLINDNDANKKKAKLVNHLEDFLETQKPTLKLNRMYTRARALAIKKTINTIIFGQTEKINHRSKSL